MFPFDPRNLSPSVHITFCRHAILVMFTDGKTKAVTPSLPLPSLRLHQVSYSLPELPITSVREACSHSLWRQSIHISGGQGMSGHPVSGFEVTLRKQKCLGVLHMPPGSLQFESEWATHRAYSDPRGSLLPLRGHSGRSLMG